MKDFAFKIIPILLVWLFCDAGLVLAQGDQGITKTLQSSYDLMGTGKFDQAQKVLEELLKRDPGNSFALNGLAVIMVKKGKNPQALDYLKQALVRAKGQRMTMDRPCDIGGLCIGLPVTESTPFSEDFEQIIKLNIVAVLIADMEKMEEAAKGYKGR
jgi:tetratricopeptide (TPR) repeat protein